MLKQLKWKAALCIITLCTILLSSTMEAHGSHKVRYQIASSEIFRFGFVGDPTSELVDFGFKWFRPHPGPANWNTIEKTAGNYDWSELDKFVVEAQKLDVQILFTIWPFADWDQETCNSNLPEIYDEFTGQGLAKRRGKPCNIDAYVDFVKALVERYDGDGVDDIPNLLYPVKYWEVSNEPEMQEPQLTFFQGTAEEYFEILKATYEAIKEADPEAKVLHGGAAGALDWMISFWDEVFSLGGGKYFDIANIHSINGLEDLNTGNFSKLLQKHGISKPIWVTEAQISSGKVKEGQRSEEDQASLIVKGYVEAFANGAEKIFYTSFREDPYMPEEMRGACLIDQTGHKKVAYFTLQTLIEKLAQFTSVEKIVEGQYRFEVNGETIYVLWGAGRVPEEVVGEVIVTDIYGKAQQKDASTIQLTDSPIFVEKAAQPPTFPTSTILIVTIVVLTATAIIYYYRKMRVK